MAIRNYVDSLMGKVKEKVIVPPDVREQTVKVNKIK